MTDGDRVIRPQFYAYWDADSEVMGGMQADPVYASVFPGSRLATPQGSAHMVRHPGVPSADLRGRQGPPRRAAAPAAVGQAERVDSRDPSFASLPGPPQRPRKEKTSSKTTQYSKTYTPQPEKDMKEPTDSPKFPAEKADRQKQKDSKFGIKTWKTTSYLPALSALERLPESDDECMEPPPPKTQSINLSREQAQRARRGAEEAETSAEAVSSGAARSAAISGESPQPALQSWTPPPLPAAAPQMPLPASPGTGTPRLASQPAYDSLMTPPPVTLMLPPALPSMSPSHTYAANTGMWSYPYQAAHYMHFADPGLRTA